MRRRQVPAKRIVMAWVALAVMTAAVVGALAGPAAAHNGDEAYAYLDVTETSLGGRIDVPVPDLEEALGIDLETGSIDELIANVNANREAIVAYLDEHFDIGAAGVSWTVDFGAVEPLFEDVSTAVYVLFPFSVDVPVNEVPRILDVTFDPFVDEIADRRPVALIRNDWGAGVVDADRSRIAVFDSGTRSQSIDLGDTGWWKNFRASIDLGVDHIKTGPDHILFVMVLVLPSVAIFAGIWRPAPTFGSALWRVLKIVTMFTVAHSITFTLAGLDILPLPLPRVTESIIALSIAVAALNNIRPLAPNKEWMISFAFGLFHGMGFASLVDGLDVDRSTQLVSLLGRNVGIEIGQSAVVIFVFPALYLVRRTNYYRPFLVESSVVLSVVSLGWMIERMFETDLGVNDWVDPVVKWPRSLASIAVITALFAVLFVRERNAQRLLPVYDADADYSSNPSDDDGTSSPSGDTHQTGDEVSLDV
jgi:hypothetical protein